MMLGLLGVAPLAIGGLAPGQEDLAKSRAALAPALGSWRAWLDSPGGELRFGLNLDEAFHRLRARLVNAGQDTIVAGVTFEDGVLKLDVDPYDSHLTARVGDHGRRLDGDWWKCSGPDRWTHLTFHAEFLPPDRPSLVLSNEPPRRPFQGRWDVRFEKSKEPAVGIFGTCLAGELEGTFLTTLGDYRYLAGTEGWELVGTGEAIDFWDTLDLSCFDGAHAFLFKARRMPDGTLAGDFWSGDSWHETWTAKRDEHAKLPDPFGLTAAIAKVPLAELSFPDLQGARRSLADPAFAGQARILQVFGSWCPNCNDEAEYLAELDRRYRSRGLSIVGLAFELTGEFARDSKQVALYAERHKLAYPLLVAGLADKEAASKSIPLLDRVRAYPTTIFLRGDGTVRAVHQGFSGPATGPEHLKLREDFERLIEELLAPTPRAR